MTQLCSYMHIRSNYVKLLMVREVLQIN